MDNPATITIGIDSSSSCCGIAIFEDGIYKESFAKVFDGPYNIQKFRTMTTYFDNLLADYLPDIVLLEEPLAVRNGRVTRVLNQVGGMIFGLASTYAKTIDTIHPKTVKSRMKIKDKKDSIIRAKQITGKTCTTDDESDAILIVETYKVLVGELV